MDIGSRIQDAGKGGAADLFGEFISPESAVGETQVYVTIDEGRWEVTRVLVEASAGTGSHRMMGGAMPIYAGRR